MRICQENETRILNTALSNVYISVVEIPEKVIQIITCLCNHQLRTYVFAYIVMCHLKCFVFVLKLLVCLQTFISHHHRLLII